MKQTLYILAFLFLKASHVSGQTAADTMFTSLSQSKNNSIFESVNSGTFAGKTSGFIQIVHNNDTLLLDFQCTNTTLKINKIEEPVYDDNTKVYSTQTTSGKTMVQYETFTEANVLTIVLNGVHYGVGVFDGASDTPVSGLTFHYCHEKNAEYVTLFVTKPLRLTTSAYVFNKGNISYHEASKNEKAVIVLPGSTLIMTIIK